MNETAKKSKEELLEIRRKNVAAARAVRAETSANSNKNSEFTPERIREIREALDMTGLDFLRATGVDIGKWERSESRPSGSGIGFLILVEHFGPTAIEALRQARRRHRSL